GPFALGAFAVTEVAAVEPDLDRRGFRTERPEGQRHTCGDKQQGNADRSEQSSGTCARRHGGINANYAAREVRESSSAMQYHGVLVSALASICSGYHRSNRID